ncbi:uncharacterized protein LOC126811025 [Patella vulgata]|uniref:uncharacterized protein LOC126811025 n=1 Tax=Patella vulgata TaxID=6465 RepID=UPI0024A83044|nr:uncharacterized protein LOC126811025 [Patella vulgata]
MDICNATCCRYQGTNEDQPGFTSVNQTDRLSVYRNCSNQPTCTVTSPYSPDTDYDYISYPYFCVSDNIVYNMMEITDVRFSSISYLYYSGKTQTTGTTITRCCNITSPETIFISSVYIYLTEESSYNVKIYSENQTLIRSVDGVSHFYGYRGVSISGDKIYHLVLDNLTADEDDYIWIQLIGTRPTPSGSYTRNVNITCDDCIGFTASGTDTNSKNTSTEETSNLVISTDTSQISTDTNSRNSLNEVTSISKGTDTISKTSSNEATPNMVTSQMSTDINSKNPPSNEVTSNMVTSQMSTDTNSKTSSTGTDTNNKNSSNEETSTDKYKDNNNGGVNTGLTVGIIVVSLLLMVTLFIGGVYCIRRKMKQTKHSREEQNMARAVNTVDTSLYAGLTNIGGLEHDYSDLVNHNGHDVVNNHGPAHVYAGIVNRNLSDAVNGRPGHDYTGPVYENRPDAVINGEHSTDPNETGHGYTAVGHPTRVQTEASTNDDYENTFVNTNEQ